DVPLTVLRVSDSHALRPNLLASLSDDELSPAALAARVVLAETVRALVKQGRWSGVRLHKAGGVRL
ncbi:MAG TPA: LysR family transcriptional regulator, partial [Burkholderiales bacterium]